MSTYRTGERWEPRAVTALPTEWTNVFYNPRAAADPWYFERCPALLLVEKVAEESRSGRMDDEYDADGIHETEVCFATVCEFGDIGPVQPGGGYLCTIPGGEPDDAAREKILKQAVADGEIKLPAETAS